MRRFLPFFLLFLFAQTVFADAPIGGAEPAILNFQPAPATKKFVDPKGKFALEIPVSWAVSDMESPNLRTVYWAFDKDSAPSLSLAIAPKTAFPNGSLTNHLLDMVGQTAPVTREKPQPAQWQNHAAQSTDWTYQDKKTPLEGRSLEWSEGETIYAVSFGAPKRDSDEFRAVEKLAQTLQIGPQKPVAQAAKNWDGWAAEMEEILAQMKATNERFSSRAINEAATESIEVLDQKRATTPPISRERADAARIQARAVAAKAWELVTAGKSEQAEPLFGKRAALQKEAYLADKQFLQAQIDKTASRVEELQNFTPTIDLSFSVMLVREGWLDLQAIHSLELQFLAIENSDPQTQAQSARGEWQARKTQLKNNWLAATPETTDWKLRRQVASALGSLGGAAQQIADYQGANAYYLAALQWRRALPEQYERRDVAFALRDLAALEGALGDLQAARDYYLQGLKALDEVRAQREAAIGAEKDERMRDLMRAEFYQTSAMFNNNLGVLAQSAGDYSAAQKHFDAAFKAVEPIAQTGFAGRVRADMTATTKGNLAVLRADSGQLEEAAKILAEVIQDQRELGNDAGVALGLLNRAGLLASQNDVPAAMRDLAQARQMFAQLELPLRLVAADNFAAKLALETEKPEQIPVAQKLAKSALELARAQKDNEWIAVTARLSAKILLDQLPANPSAAQLAPAAKWVAEAADARSGIVTSVMSTLAVKAKLREIAGDLPASLALLEDAIARLEAVRATTIAPSDFADLKENYVLYERIVRLLLKMNRPAEAFDYLARARTKKLADSLRLANLKNADPAIQTLLDKAANLEAKLGTVRAKLDIETALPPAERDPKRLENLKVLVASTQAEFFQVSHALREKYPNYDKIVPVQPRELKKAQRTIPENAVLVQYAPLGDQLYIFVVTRDDLKIFTPPVLPKDLNTQIRKFRRLIDSASRAIQRGDKPEELTETSPLGALSIQLYNELIAPVESEIAAKSVVAIIPTQELYYLPFHALAKPTPKGLRFLIEDKQLAVLAAADVLSVVQTRDLNQFGAGVLALGDPKGADLPAAREEVAAITKIFPASRALTGDAAAKSVLLQPQNLERRILHLAAHGVLDAQQPNRSYIQLSPSGADDGRLSVGEVYGLDLGRVDLVTLSACQTALGEGAPDGAEITSLAESFSSAGTPSVVASLWSVEDNSTRQLMETFYRSLADGKSKSLALQNAQLALLKNPATRHPFFWAPFELLGDWR